MVSCTLLFTIHIVFSTTLQDHCTNTPIHKNIMIIVHCNDDGPKSYCKVFEVFWNVAAECRETLNPFPARRVVYARKTSERVSEFAEVSVLFSNVIYKSLSKWRKCTVNWQQKLWNWTRLVYSGMNDASRDNFTLIHTRSSFSTLMARNARPNSVKGSEGHQPAQETDVA